MWKRKRETEVLPWYRARNYQGKMTEAQKLELDAFRSPGPHPASDYDSLPAEVQHYIRKLEMEVYDSKQKKIAARALFVTAIGALLAFQMYFGGLKPTPWGIAYSAFCMIMPWFAYWYAFKKNAEEFLHADEGLRMAWEIEHLGRRGTCSRIMVKSWIFDLRQPVLRTGLADRQRLCRNHVIGENCPSTSLQ